MSQSRQTSPGQSTSPQRARRPNATWDYSIAGSTFRHRTSVNRYTSQQFSPNSNTAVQSGTLTPSPKLTLWKVCTNLPAKLSQGSGKPTPHLCISPSTGPLYPNAGRSKSSRYATTYLTTFQSSPQHLLSHIPTPPLVTLIQKLFLPHLSALMPINFPFFIDVIHHWNSLPLHIVNSPSPSSYKQNLTKHLIQST